MSRTQSVHAPHGVERTAGRKGVGMGRAIPEGGGGTHIHGSRPHFWAQMSPLARRLPRDGCECKVRPRFFAFSQTQQRFPTTTVHANAVSIVSREERCARFSRAHHSDSPHSTTINMSTPSLSPSTNAPLSTTPPPPSPRRAAPSTCACRSCLRAWRWCCRWRPGRSGRRRA